MTAITAESDIVKHLFKVWSWVGVDWIDYGGIRYYEKDV